MDFQHILTILTCLLSLTSTAARQSIHYLVGSTEVSESFWMSIPDSLKNGTGEFSSDTLIIKEISLPLTHYIDTVSTPGNHIIKRHSPETIAEIEGLHMGRISAQRKSSLCVEVGDTAPNIDLINLSTEAVEENIIKTGKCYLLSFWTTWCGNCLHELKPDGIPQIAKDFEEKTQTSGS